MASTMVISCEADSGERKKMRITRLFRSDHQTRVVQFQATFRFRKVVF